MTQRLLITVALTLAALPAAHAQTKNVKITLQARGALGEGSAKAFRKALSGINGVKFKSEDIVKGKELRFFSDPFEIEVVDLKKTPLGAIAKSMAAAKTPVRDDLTPGVNLIIYSRDAISERTFGRVRGNLGNVKGIAIQGRGNMGASINDAYYWIRIDNSGQARLADIVHATRQSGIKISLTNPSP